MLIKEYRIPMPLSVQEYRIAQLYMIQKKSREESKGKDSGVEIIKNEPYTEGPGGSGQYTQKRYHISSHVPGWVLPILPKDSLIVVEEAWNAYPYTKTRFSCPLVEKFMIEMETLYYNDAGHQPNVFKLTDQQRKNIKVDLIDIVKEQPASADYMLLEDPKLFHSAKSQRGPLADDWLDSSANLPSVMCAYKICKVEFKYWGMQTKMEKFIHDVALRKTMLRAHKQAWCWQDEWFGLTMDDIRRLEHETQLSLKRKFEQMNVGSSGYDEEELATTSSSSSSNPQHKSPPSSYSALSTTNNPAHDVKSAALLRRSSNHSLLSATSKRSQLSESFRIEGLRRDSIDSSSSDEYFDAFDESPEWLSDDNDVASTTSSNDDDDEEFAEPMTTEERERKLAAPTTTSASATRSKFSVLVLVVHGGNGHVTPAPSSNQRSDSPNRAPESKKSLNAKQSDLQTMQATFESVISRHYKAAANQIAFRLVSCPTEVTSKSYAALHRLSPTTDPTCSDARGSSSSSSSNVEQQQWSMVTPSLMSLFVAASPQYDASVELLAQRCNFVVDNFRLSDEGRGFGGKICVIADTVGSIMAHDLLCTRHSSTATSGDTMTTRDASQEERRRASNDDQIALLIHNPTVDGGSGSRASQIGRSPLAGGTCAPQQQQQRSRANTNLNPHHQRPRRSVASCTAADCERVAGAGGSASRRGRHRSNLAPVGGGGAKPRSRTVGDCSQDEEDDEGGECEGYDPLMQSSASVGNCVSEELMRRKYGSFASRLERENSRNYEDDDDEPSDILPLHNNTHHHHHSDIAISNDDGGSGEGNMKSSPLIRLNFDVTHLYMLGSPLSLLLTMRRLVASSPSLPRARCEQVYNVYYPSDPTSVRLEPFINERMAAVPACKIPTFRYFPYGDEQTNLMGETLVNNQHLFDLSADDQTGSPATPATFVCSRRSKISPAVERQSSLVAVGEKEFGRKEESASSNLYCDLSDSKSMSEVLSSWWGSKRVDYSLFSPEEALSNIPHASLAHIFHASFWESTDFAAFVIRQLFHQEPPVESQLYEVEENRTEVTFSPPLKQYKWKHKRTYFKIRNMNENHRSKDVLAVEGGAQVLQGRFSYGPLDMVSLNDEQVDIYVLSPSQPNEWRLLTSQATNNHGKVTYALSEEERFGQGLYQLRMVVRGDLTHSHSYLAVLPPHVECVVFSIDGSFTTTFSIMANDPKVRPSAVDVVRRWQDMGYMILYVTARPDIQKNRVISWLSQHNFPHGMVWFCDSISPDPLRHKTMMLKNLQSEYQLQFSAAYGSAKDVAVYSQLNIEPNRIFIVGKPKKQMTNCTWLVKGYSHHLDDLAKPEFIAPARFNAHAIFGRRCFRLPARIPTASGTSSGAVVASSSASVATASGHRRKSKRAIEMGGGVSNS